MYKVGRYAVLKMSKTIKIIDEIEDIDSNYILYMTDGTSYHISQLMTIHEAAKLEGCEI